MKDEILENEVLENGVQDEVLENEVNNLENEVLQNEVLNQLKAKDEQIQSLQSQVKELRQLLSIRNTSIDTNFYTIEQLSQLFGMGWNSIWKLIKSKKIKAFKPGRHWVVSEKDASEFLQARSNFAFDDCDNCD